MSLKNHKKLIAGALIGNIMEFFDFIIYAYLSNYITSQFFPFPDAFVANMLTFSVFASGYLTRPLGAILFGYIGDKLGRKTALLQSVILITLATVCIGLLPVHSQIGFLAPFLLIICRLTQGLAVSGEQSGAAVYLSESLNSKQRGFIGAMVLGSSYVGVLLGSLTCLFVSSSLSVVQMQSFGWRIPFLCSLILGGTALFFRLKSVESVEFSKIKAENKISSTPIKDTFKFYGRQVLIMTLLLIGLAVPIYMYTIYIPNYLSMVSGFSDHKSLVFSSFGLLFFSCVVPMIGRLSDKMGYEKMLFTGFMLSTCLGYPIFLMLASGDNFYVILGQATLGITVCLIAAPILGVIMKRFPTHLSYTAVSFVTNTGMAIFGGTVPMISMLLIKLLANKASPGLYLSVSGFIGILTLYYSVFKTSALPNATEYARG